MLSFNAPGFVFRWLSGRKDGDVLVTTLKHKARQLFPMKIQLLQIRNRRSHMFNDVFYWHVATGTTKIAKVRRPDCAQYVATSLGLVGGIARVVVLATSRSMADYQFSVRFSNKRGLADRALALVLLQWCRGGKTGENEELVPAGLHCAGRRLQLLV